jgi:hypothetical protein
MKFATAALCGSLAFTAALFAAPADSAAQQIPCNQRNDVLGHLAKIYQELPIAVGVTNRGGLVEVLSTGDGKTWTIIISSPDGETCMIAAGKSWRALPETGTRDGPHA